MNEILKNMMERRSIRQFSAKPVEEDTLQEILQAALYSPNAGNRQTTRLVVCQDSAINDTLGKIHRLLFMKYKTAKPGEPVVLAPGDLDKPGIESSFYGAPTVITLFGVNHFLFADADAYIMANNICLAAKALNIGSCIICVATDYFQNDYGRERLQEWGVPDNYQVRAHVLIGYPADGFPEAKPRKYPEIVFVRPHRPSEWEKE